MRNRRGIGQSFTVEIVPKFGERHQCTGFFLFCICFAGFEVGSHYVTQAGFELLIFVPQAGITGM
jgi:hypothetical protein